VLSPALEDAWNSRHRAKRALTLYEQHPAGHASYLDEGVYIHACPSGVEIGPNTLVMHGAVLHVYNFRQLPNSGIRIGRDCLIGEYFCDTADRVGSRLAPGLYLTDDTDHRLSIMSSTIPERPVYRGKGSLLKGS